MQRTLPTSALLVLLFGGACFAGSTSADQDSEQVQQLRSKLDAFLRLSDEQLRACVPYQNRLVCSACPNCREWVNLQRGWIGEPTDPNRIQCGKCRLIFPNDQFPVNAEQVFLNELGEEVTIRFHKGAPSRPYVDKNQQTMNVGAGGPPEHYMLYGAIDNERFEWLRDNIRTAGQLLRLTTDPECERRTALAIFLLAKRIPHFLILRHDGYLRQYYLSTGGPWRRDGKLVGRPGKDLPYGHWLSTLFHRKGWWGDVQEIAPFYETYFLIKDRPSLRALSRDLGEGVGETIERDMIRYTVDNVIRYRWHKAHLLNNLIGYSHVIGQIGKAIGEPEHVHFEYQWVSRILDDAQFCADGLCDSGIAYYRGHHIHGLARLLEGYSDPPGFVSKVDGLHLENVDLIRSNPFYTKAARRNNGAPVVCPCES